jgi:hypothetical protein
MIPTAGAAMAMKLISARLLRSFRYPNALIVNIFLIVMSFCLFALIGIKTPSPLIVFVAFALGHLRFSSPLFHEWHAGCRHRIHRFEHGDRDRQCVSTNLGIPRAITFRDDVVQVGQKIMAMLPTLLACVIDLFADILQPVANYEELRRPSEALVSRNT